jgi:hypothetical protein
VDPRRYGKLPLSSQTPEAKEKEEYALENTNEFDAYNYESNSNWCPDTDLSTMVSALSQVIGTSSTNHNHPHMAQSTSNTMVNEESQPPQPLLDQGLFLKLYVCFLCSSKFSICLVNFLNGTNLCYCWSLSIFGEKVEHCF